MRTAKRRANNNFGRFTERVRLICGYPQERVGIALKLDQSGISRIEAGTQFMSIEELFKFAHLIKVSANTKRKGRLMIHIWQSGEFGASCVRCGYLSVTDEAKDQCSGAFDEKLLDELAKQIILVEEKIRLIGDAQAGRDSKARQERKDKEAGV